MKTCPLSVFSSQAVALWIVVFYVKSGMVNGSFPLAAINAIGETGCEYELVSLKDLGQGKKKSNKSSRRGRRLPKKDDNDGELEFNQQATPATIFGSGNTNGFYTCTRKDSVELCLRAKIRFAVPQNPTAEVSNNDGTYNVPAGVPTSCFSFNNGFCNSAFSWNYEWSINKDYDESSGLKLNDVEHFEIGMDCDPSCDTYYTIVNPFDIPTWLLDIGVGQPDHSIGDQNTLQGGGEEAGNLAEYENLILNNHVAQNSWNYEFFNSAGTCLFYANPAREGTYTIYMKASVDGEEYIVSIDVEATTPP